MGAIAVFGWGFLAYGRQRVFAAAGARAGEFHFVHKPAGAWKPQANTSARRESFTERRLEVSDPGPFVSNHVPCQFRDRGRDPTLIQVAEAQAARNFARALAGEDDVVLTTKYEGHDHPQTRAQ